MKQSSFALRTVIVLAAALMAGTFFRFLWPLDIEMKFDEAETFNLLRDWRRGDIPFPWLGQDSSSGLHHPALGVWIFLFLGKIFPVETIADLGHVPPALAVLNLLLLVGFATFFLRERQRLHFYWAIALMAVNPFLVLLDRKLWHPSVMGLFVSGLLLSWLKRETKLGSFLMGLFVLLPGQVHMSGFMLAVGFAAADFYYNRWDAVRKVRLAPFLAGLILSLLPMLSWIHWLFHGAQNDDPLSFNLLRLLNLKYVNFWFANAYGLLGPYPFGAQIYRDPLYGITTAVCGVIALVGGVIFLRRAWRFLRRRERAEITQWEMFGGLGTGAVAIASLMSLSRYFTLCLGIIPFLSVVRSVLSIRRRGPLILGTLLITQALASSIILLYVHRHASDPDASAEPFGVYGLPLGDCGACEVGPTLERISGGTVIVPNPAKPQKAGQ